MPHCQASSNGRSIRDGSSAEELLPPYMVPDTFTFLSDLPTTSTDKVDYQGLKRLAASPV